MVDADLIAAKLGELAHRTARVREHCPEDASKLAADADALDLVSFNLMLAIQICLDVASHVIADEGWPPATDLAGSFRRLGERGVLTTTTASALARAAGLRNVVAHVYGQANATMVHAAATRGLSDLEAFAREIASWVKNRPASSAH